MAGLKIEQDLLDRCKFRFVPVDSGSALALFLRTANAQVSAGIPARDAYLAATNKIVIDAIEEIRNSTAFIWAKRCSTEQIKFSSEISYNYGPLPAVITSLEFADANRALQFKLAFGGTAAIQYDDEM